MITMRTMVLGLMLVAGTTAVAQPPRDAGARPQRAERMQRAGRGMHAGLFRGIQLSEAERAKVQQVHERYRPRMEQAMQANRTANEGARAQVREARERGDTAALRALRASAASRTAAMRPLMDSLRAEMRAALTPEHQQRFDANVASMKTRAARTARAGGRPGAQRAARGMRPGQARGARSARAQRAPRAQRAQRARAMSRVELSAEERARVQQVNEKYRARLTALRQAMAPDVKAVREARQRGDTAAARASMQKVAQQRASISALGEQRRVEARAALSAATRQKLDSLRTRRQARAPRG
jgi:Spy/CpxP family protein refolding chaperone